MTSLFSVMIIRISIVTLLFSLVLSVHSSGLQDITPVPKEHFDPRVSEFLRIDGNGDQQITFAEFILGDTEYIREQSKNFHRFDTNGDNVITKAEYDGYFKNHEGGRMGGRRGEHDDFMRRMHAPHPSHGRESFFEPSRRPEFPDGNDRFGKEERRGGPRFSESTPRFPSKDDDSREEMTLLPSPPQENREREGQGEDR
ncbi:hypothetical protein PRIPAC_79159 [Pristionchus pacificus]|uniref:HLH domain-containing protein n=1 Tax=Pristionchus pacificus TaxID=54126 RepID=A0A2A6BEA5_PRIPA|nr:hypothetical protein PRIPAC_79159 [Pristionchus pacificus]|eukprot:PDM64186.1 HLH domain-containing protein [Pristionchus pacificus]